MNLVHQFGRNRQIHRVPLALEARIYRLPAPQLDGLLLRANVLIFILLFFAPLSQVLAADIPLAAGCSLRQAIDSANAEDGSSQIGSCAIGSIGADRVILTRNALLSGGMLPPITSTIRIVGAGYTIDGDRNRAFRVNGGDLTIDNATLTNTHSEGYTSEAATIYILAGRVSLNNVTITDASTGRGAIYLVEGSLNVRDSVFTDINLPAIRLASGEATVRDTTISDINPSGSVGAVRVEGGTLTITGSSLSGNRAGDGGAIHLTAGTLNVSRSVFSDNIAGDKGGAIYIESGSATLDRITVRNNSGENGGGIYIEDGTVMISSSTISGNTTNDEDGAGIYHEAGTTTISNSTVSGNHSLEDGGGMFVDDGALSIIDSAFVDNTAVGGGGGIYGFGDAALTITGSAFANNSAEYGGGIRKTFFTSQIWEIKNSSFYGNSASETGGAINFDEVLSPGTSVFTHLTITGNSASSGGNLHIDGGSLSLRNSIVYGNSGDDCSGTLTEEVGNIIGTGNCVIVPTPAPGDPTPVPVGPIDPRLGRAQGSPGYIPIAANSPARDAGDRAYCEEFDQRGVRREAACDIGAYEYFPAPKVEKRAGVAGPPPRPTPDLQTCLTLNRTGDIFVTNIADGTQCQQLDAAGIGVRSIVDSGYIDAVDVWGWVVAGTRVCFQANGSLIFLDAATAPRAVIPWPAFGSGGMTCGTIDRPGSLVLVPGPLPPPLPATPVPARSLTGCSVTMTHNVNFRATPGGVRINVLAMGRTFKALSRTDDWFEVQFFSKVGWVSADYVTTEGSCG